MMTRDSPTTEAVRALVVAYAERLDAGDLDGVAALFEHAVLRPARSGRPLVGSDAVRRLYDPVVLYEDGTPRTRHVLSNLEVTLDPAGDGAASRCVFTVWQARPGGRAAARAGRPLRGPLRPGRRPVAFHRAGHPRRPARRPLGPHAPMSDASRALAPLVARLSDRSGPTVVGLAGGVSVGQVHAGRGAAGRAAGPGRRGQHRRVPVLEPGARRAGPHRPEGLPRVLRRRCAPVVPHRARAGGLPRPAPVLLARDVRRGRGAAGRRRSTSSSSRA